MDDSGQIRKGWRDRSVGKLLARIDPRMALAKSVVVWVAFAAGGYVTGHIHGENRMLGAMLAAVSGIVVLQGDIRTSVRQGWLRVLGTFIGAVLACLYLTFFRFTLPGMVLMVFLLEILCMLLKIPDNGKMATITLVIISVVSVRYPDLPAWANGLLRFTEATIGALAGIAAARVLRTVRNRIPPPGP